MRKGLFINLVSIILIISFENLHAQSPYPTDYFSSPVDFRIYLSANFAEIRGNHFHSGLDIKTKGRSGEIIRSIADGEIVRIGVSPGGFGNALYINHPNGYTSVYGHLDKFSEEVAEYVKTNQYKRESFAVNLYPPKGRFVVKKGDLIAYSGNSGSSLGPHLHFEIRETKSQHPTNPLLYGFDISDNIAPIVKSIYLYPGNDKSSVNYEKDKKRYLVAKNGSTYTLRSDSVVRFSGKIGVGIEAYDLLNGVGNKCGVYSIEMLVDGKRYTFFEQNEFSFSETRYINSHIDYEERVRRKRNIRQTFIAPNNRLRIYETSLNGGLVNFNDEEIHNIKLILKDVYNNTSTVNFRVKSETEYTTQMDNTEVEYLMLMPYNTPNKYTFNGFELDMPANTLYDTLKFRFMVTPAIPGSFSRVFHVHERYTPSHKYFTIRIKPKNVPDSLHNKLLIGGLDDNQKIFARNGEWKDSTVVIKTRDFGSYLVVMDTIAPSILPNNFRRNSDLSGKKSLRFTVRDDFSGISTYKGYIDGKWALFEYDPKYDRISYTLDKDRIGSNKEHELVLTVSDMKNNEKTFNMKFFW